MSEQRLIRPTLRFQNAVGSLTCTSCSRDLPVYHPCPPIHTGASQFIARVLPIYRPCPPLLKGPPSLSPLSEKARCSIRFPGLGGGGEKGKVVNGVGFLAISLYAPSIFNSIHISTSVICEEPCAPVTKPGCLRQSQASYLISYVIQSNVRPI